MITRIFYGIIFIALFAFFIGFGLLQKTVDFVVEFVSAFNSLGIFFQDPQLQLLAGMVAVVLALMVVVAFKK